MKILIIDEVHDLLVRGLINNNHEVDYSPDLPYNSLLNQVEKYDGLIVRSKYRIDEKIIEKGQNLKFLARAGVGLDIFDLETARSKGIQIINAAGANANAVAEHAIGMLLSLMHNIQRSSIEVQNFKWNRGANRGQELLGKTIGVIGYGNTGKSFAKKIKAFGCNVLAYDKYLTAYTDEYVTETSLEQIKEHCEVVSLHIPLTDESRQFCDRSFFNSFTKNIYFLNTSRGKIVNTNDLLSCLDTGKVKAAGLDVLEIEKVKEFSEQEKAIINHPNTIVTPHIAGWSHQSYQAISEVLLKRIESLTI